MHHGHINKHVVVNGQSHECADQFKLVVGLQTLPIEPEQLVVRVILEHSQVRVEYFFHDQQQKLSCQTALIDTCFAFEHQFQGQFDRVLAADVFTVLDFLDGLTEDVLTRHLHDVMVRFLPLFTEFRIPHGTHSNGLTH